MKTKSFQILILAIGFFTTVRATEPLAPQHSFFDPGTNRPGGAQQGYSVAVAGELIAVGAPFDDLGATDSGVVNIYGLNHGSLLYTLTNPVPAASDGFGAAVAISGTRVVVGAFQNDTGANNAGIVYVYDVASLDPVTPLHTLTNPAPAANDIFGSAVAISGTRVLVGAEQHPAGTNANAGTAYVYDVAGLVPTVPFLTLTNPAPIDGETDRFGHAVAIWESKVVVGAPGGFNGKGSAYIFDVTNASPQVPVVIPTNFVVRTENSRFGNAVAIAEDRVVIGAEFDAAPGGSDDAGSAFVYDLTGSSPSVPFLTLRGPAPNRSDHFANSVAISGDLVVIGESGDNTDAADAGRAYLFDLANLTPGVPITTFADPNPAVGNQFGFAVAIYGPRILIGARLDDTGDADRGAAHLFAFLPILSISPAESGFVTISWTSSVLSGFVLQSKHNSTVDNWTNTPSGAENPVTVPIVGLERFYRLFRP